MKMRAIYMIMESQFSCGSTSSCEERLLPPLPPPGSQPTDSPDPELPTTTALPIRPRISTQNFCVSRIEEEIPEQVKDDRESKSTTSMPVTDLTQNLRMFLGDSSNMLLNSYSTNRTYVSSNSNVPQQDTDSHNDRKTLSASAGEVCLSSRTLPRTLQHASGLERPRARSDSSRNTHSLSRHFSRLSSAPVSVNQLETREVILPMWQLDSEARFCPICKAQFNFFLRKHHCRRCGRVVCSSCSPHRIIIPFQYIVEPLNHADTSNLRLSGIHQYDLHNSSEDLGGGRQVRLCNPCVPDLNTLSPPIATDESEQYVQNFNYSYNQSTNMRSRENPFRVVICGSTGASETVPRDSQIHSQQQGLLRDNANVARGSGSSPRTVPNRRREHRFESVGPLNQLNSGNTSSLPADTQAFQSPHFIIRTPQRERLLPKASNSSNPRTSEEDECWVCHQDLPSKDNHDYEVLRAAHVNSCIETATQMASGSRNIGNDTQNLDPRNEFEHRTSDETNNSENQGFRASPRQHIYGANSNKKRRRTGVFSYKATEKDCIDNAECIICLEEFDVGIEMGRLECFCRFHLKCIRKWFKSKPGMCPVHQSGFYH